MGETSQEILDSPGFNVFFGHVASNVGDRAINRGLIEMVRAVSPSSKIRFLIRGGANSPHLTSSLESMGLQPNSIDFVPRSWGRRELQNSQESPKRAFQRTDNFNLLSLGELVFGAPHWEPELEAWFSIFDLVGQDLSPSIALPATFGPFADQYQAEGVARLLPQDSWAYRDSKSKAEFLSELHNSRYLGAANTAPVLLDPAFFHAFSQRETWNSSRTDGTNKILVSLRFEGFGIRIAPEERRGMSLEAKKEQFAHSVSLKVTTAILRDLIRESPTASITILIQSDADKAISRALASNIRKFFPNQSIVLQRPQSVSAFSRLIQEHGTVVSSRFHTLVYALSFGKLAVGVALPGLGHKIPGLWELVGAPNELLWNPGLEGESSNWPGRQGLWDIHAGSRFTVESNIESLRIQTQDWFSQRVFAGTPPKQPAEVTASKRPVDSESNVLAQGLRPDEAGVNAVAQKIALEYLNPQPSIRPSRVRQGISEWWKLNRAFLRKESGALARPAAASLKLADLDQLQEHLRTKEIGFWSDFESTAIRVIKDGITSTDPDLREKAFRLSLSLIEMHPSAETLETGALASAVSGHDGLAISLMADSIEQSGGSYLWKPGFVRATGLLAAMAFVPERENRAISRDSNQILYFLHNSFPFMSGGYANRSHGIARALVEDGRKVDVVTRPGFPAEMQIREPESHHAIDGVSYHLATQFVNRASANYVMRAAAEFEAWIWQLRPALVIAGSFAWSVGLPALIAARRTNTPILYDVRGQHNLLLESSPRRPVAILEYRMDQMAEVFVAENSDYYSTITDALQVHLRKLGLSRNDNIPLPNGVDTARFASWEKRDSSLPARQNQSAISIGYVGSFVSYEGIEILIEAATMLLSSRRRFELVMVGADLENAPFGSVAHSLAKQLRQKGLWKYVVNPGRVDPVDIPTWYKRIDILVYPRLSTPVTEVIAPLKPLEAMASGKAVIASNLPPISEIIRDGETGLLVPPNDSKELFKALSALIDDSVARETFGREAKKWAQSTRSWARIVSRLTDSISVLGPAKKKQVNTSDSGTSLIGEERQT